MYTGRGTWRNPEKNSYIREKEGARTQARIKGDRTGTENLETQFPQAKKEDYTIRKYTTVSKAHTTTNQKKQRSHGRILTTPKRDIREDNHLLCSTWTSLTIIKTSRWKW